MRDYVPDALPVPFRDRELLLVAIVVVMLVLPWTVPLDSAGWIALGVIIAFGAWYPRVLILAVPVSIGLSFRSFPVGSMALNPLEVLVFAAIIGAAPRALIAGWSNRHRLVALVSSTIRVLFPHVLVLLLVVGLAVAGVLSLFTLADPEHTRESVRLFRWTIVLPLAFYVLARLVLREQYDRTRLAGLFVIGAVIASAVAVVDGLAGGGITADAAVRLSGLAPHPNALALYLERAAVLAILVGILFRERVAPWWLGSGAFVALVTVATLSRGAFLGMTVGLLAMLLITRLRKQAIYAGVAAGFTLAFTLVAFPERALSLLGGGSGSLRIELWRSSLRMVRDHPWFGVGLDQFLYQYLPRYVSPAAWPERFTSHPHNLVLEAWLSLGIIGLVLLALFAAFWSRSVRIGISASDRLTLASCGALAAIFVHGLLDRSYFLPELAVSTWLLILLLRVESDPAN